MGDNKLPSARLESLGDGNNSDGLFDVSGGFDSVAPYDYGNTDGSTSRPEHVGANSPGDPTFDAHAKNGFVFGNWGD